MSSSEQEGPRRDRRDDDADGGSDSDNVNGNGNGNGNGSEDGCGERIRKLLDDTTALLDYAQEFEGYPPEIDLTAYFVAKEKTDRKELLTTEELAGVVDCYRRLSRLYPGISPRTLAATRPDSDGRMRDSRTGKYLIRLWWWTGAVVMAVIGSNVLMYAIDTGRPSSGLDWTHWNTALDFIYEGLRHTEPFLYGALGAFAFVLRVTATRLYSRTFDPARIGEHVNRIVLGTLSGGAIVLFVSQIPTDQGAQVALSGAALGFLAGYSIDFLFGTLDRVICALLANDAGDKTGKAARARRDADVVQVLDDLVAEQPDGEARRRLGEVIETLRQRHQA